MAKRKKVIRAGPLVMATIYTPPMPRDPECVRVARSRATTDARRAMNMKVARRRLEMLFAGNYTARDLHATLTYRDDVLPRTRDCAQIRLRKFLRELRKVRRAQGCELKYVYVTEGKHGDKRYHHHLVINSTGRDLETLQSLWTYGGVDIEYIADRECSGLAAYITKESVEDKPPGAQMWTGSRNLDKPTVETMWVDDDETLTPPAGSYVLERREDQNEYGGYAYIKYRNLDIVPRKTRPPRRKP